MPSMDACLPACFCVLCFVQYENKTLNAFLDQNSTIKAHADVFAGSRTYTTSIATSTTNTSSSFQRSQSQLQFPFACSPSI